VKESGCIYVQYLGDGSRQLINQLIARKYVRNQLIGSNWLASLTIFVGGGLYMLASRSSTCSVHVGEFRHHQCNHGKNNVKNRLFC